jgi:hypothetical protein
MAYGPDALLLVLAAMVPFHDTIVEVRRRSRRADHTAPSTTCGSPPSAASTQKTEDGRVAPPFEFARSRYHRIVNVGIVSSSGLSVSCLLLPVFNSIAEILSGNIAKGSK